MTVALQTTYNTYTGNGVTTVFPYQFKILASSDLQVFVASVLKTLNVDYTVTGVGVDVGGSITFISGAPTGAVSIIRAMTPSRSTDYQQQGDFQTLVVNPDFDKPILLIQDLSTQLGRSIRTPPDEVATVPILPSVANRAGRFLGFDASGLPVALSGSGADSALRTDLANGLAGPGSDLIAIKRTAAEQAAGVIPTNYTYPELTLARYGGDPTGVANSNAAFTALFAVIAQQTKGCRAVIGPGTYLITAQLACTPQQFFRCAISAYGATIKTTGAAISALRISGGTTTGGISIYGLRIDQRGQATALYGIEVVGTSRTRIYECIFEAAGMGVASYSCVVFRNSTPSDNNTGSFWGLVQSCTFRRESSGDGAVAPFAITLQGNPNATRIVGNELEGAVCIRIQPEPGQAFIGNGILVDGNSFEGFTTAVDVPASVANPVGGLRITNNRFETGTTILSLTGATGQPPFPTYLAGNYGISNVINYLNNPNSLYVMSLDNTNDIAAMVPTWDLRGAFAIRNRDGNGHALDLRPGLDGKGVTFRNAAGAVVGSIASELVATTRMQMGSANAAEFSLFGVRGISASGTLAKNLAGSSSFAAAAAKAVVFANAEADASYQIYVSFTSDPGAAMTRPPWITAKGTGGFTVNANAAITANFDWFLVRT